MPGLKLLEGAELVDWRRTWRRVGVERTMRAVLMAARELIMISLTFGKVASDCIMTESYQLDGRRKRSVSLPGDLGISGPKLARDTSFSEHSGAPQLFGAQIRPKLDVHIVS